MQFIGWRGTKLAAENLKQVVQCSCFINKSLEQTLFLSFYHKHQRFFVKTARMDYIFHSQALQYRIV